MNVKIDNTSPESLSVEELKESYAYIDSDGDVFIMLDNGTAAMLTAYGDGGAFSWSKGELKGVEPFKPFHGTITITF